MRSYAVLGYIGLLLMGIPWFWPKGSEKLLLGLPAWVVLALGASLGASILTAWLLRKPWEGEDP